MTYPRTVNSDSITGQTGHKESSKRQSTFPHFLAFITGNGGLLVVTLTANLVVQFGKVNVSLMDLRMSAISVLLMKKTAELPYLHTYLYTFIYILFIYIYIYTTYIHIVKCIYKHLAKCTHTVCPHNIQNRIPAQYAKSILIQHAPITYKKHITTQCPYNMQKKFIPTVFPWHSAFKDLALN